MTQPLPVTIIGGYLGSGKTTLVNQMLRQVDGARLAVLVNEFGELPIDEDLIEARDDELISIAGGCICCSFGSDLAAALLKLSSFTPRPDHLVIEASGVALPAAIAHTVDLVEGLQVAGICVLADGLNIRKMSADEYIGDTIERQLTDADLVVLTKADLVAEQTLSELQSWLASGWPDRPVVTAEHGRVPNAVLLGQFPDDATRVVQPHADALYDSVVLQPEGPCDAVALSQMLKDSSFGIIRAKGYLDHLSGQCALIQLAGQRSEVSFPDDPGTKGLVCIGVKGRLNTLALQRLVADHCQPAE